MPVKIPPCGGVSEFFKGCNLILSVTVFKHSNLQIYMNICHLQKTIFDQIQIYSNVKFIIFLFEYPIFGDKYLTIPIFLNIHPTLISEHVIREQKLNIFCGGCYLGDIMHEKL